MARFAQRRYWIYRHIVSVAFAGEIEVADPVIPSSGKILGVDYFESALGLQEFDDFLSRDGVHLEVGIAVNEREPLGDFLLETLCLIEGPFLQHS